MPMGQRVVGDHNFVIGVFRPGHYLRNCVCDAIDFVEGYVPESHNIWLHEHFGKFLHFIFFYWLAFAAYVVIAWQPYLLEIIFIYLLSKLIL